MSKEKLEQAKTKQWVKEVWGAGYDKALPFLPQEFSIGGVLPAVLFMMRWGHRRGQGAFQKVHGISNPVKIPATITRISSNLLNRLDWFEGFEGETEKNILGDLMLAYCLENKKRSRGRTERVQRIFPTHYFSSWVDLPDNLSHLRKVPETVTAVLANQKEGTELVRGQKNGFFIIGNGFEKNLLLKFLGRGTSIEGESDNNLKSDVFDEQEPVGIDQLLTIRIAQSLGEAPAKAKGEIPKIPNQYPLAVRSAEWFREDFNVFLRTYHDSVPRQTLLQMLESSLAVGLSTMFLATLKFALAWVENGQLPSKENQVPWPLFVDCSVSLDQSLRRYSEESLDDAVTRLYRLPVCFMAMKILEQHIREERLKAPVGAPDPTERINYLGALLHGSLAESRDCSRDVRKICINLSDLLVEPEDLQVKRLLDNEDVHPVWRMAEAIVTLMGDKNQGSQFRKGLDSSLMMDEPNGLGKKRRITLKGKGSDRRSIVLTNTVLDFLVHRHLVKAAKGGKVKTLSLHQFLSILKSRYGFFVDEPPSGMSIPSDQLRRNREYLERRLRDLGLLIGVNDAEEMKYLRPRFEVNPDG